MTNYRRAFELDSNFVQAFLRYDYANSWILNPADPAVHRRLVALKDSLPERERLWLETREKPLPVPADQSASRRLVIAAQSMFAASELSRQLPTAISISFVASEALLLSVRP